jgi:hypothetical protein
MTRTFCFSLPGMGDHVSAMNDQDWLVRQASHCTNKRTCPSRHCRASFGRGSRHRGISLRRPPRLPSRVCHAAACVSGARKGLPACLPGIQRRWPERSILTTHVVMAISLAGNFLFPCHSMDQATSEERLLSDVRIDK